MGDLTAHFSRSELACRHCGALSLPEEFLEELEILRVAYGRPMRLSSGYRCPAYNAQVSTTGLAGPHTRGAVDVLVFGEPALTLLGLAIQMGWRGFGLHQRGPREERFVHLDRLPDGPGQPRPTVWSY
jgi:uncharacterized protein YcbK (DUF882 family)